MYTSQSCQTLSAIMKSVYTVSTLHNFNPKQLNPSSVVSQVLTRLRHYLCDKIRAERHLDYLRSRRILTRDDAEEISCRTTQTKRTAMLLDILAENPRGLDALTDSIRDMRSQNFIIAKITDEVQKAKSEKIESLRGKSGINLKFKSDLKKCLCSVCKHTFHLSLNSRGVQFLI